MSTMTNLIRFIFGMPVRAKPVDTNFQALQTAVNNTNARIDAMVMAEAPSEVVDARDFHSVLRDRLQSASKATPHVIISGFAVSAQGTPDMTVAISAGEAVIGGVAVKRAATNTPAISAPVSNSRYDVVVINADNSIGIVAGTPAVSPVYPNITDATQKAIAVIGPLTSATTAITSGMISDARDMGAWFMLNGCMQYCWKIQDAVTALSSGGIRIGAGVYIEEVDLSGKSNIELIYDSGAKHYRYSDTAYCVKCINTLGNESVGIRIINGRFYRNGKATTGMTLKFDYVNYSWLENTLFYDSTPAIDYAESTLTNCIGIMEDHHFSGDVLMVGTTAEKARRLKRGWIELTAMDDKVLRVDKDTAGSTGGSDTNTHLHSQQYALQVSLGGFTIPTYVENATISTLPAYYTLIALIHR